MGLPPALAARLKKRGIIKEKQPVEEEVFAENYDTQVFFCFIILIVIFCRNRKLYFFLLFGITVEIST